jgi:hypothetical protein
VSAAPESFETCDDCHERPVAIWPPGDHRAGRTVTLGSQAMCSTCLDRTITPIYKRVSDRGELPEQQDAADDATADNKVRNVAESFTPVDLAAVLAGDIAQPVPTMLVRRGHGVESALIYPGMVNGLHGDSGIGKSWAAVLLLAERIAAGENVILLDLEDTPQSIVSRLKLLGVSEQAMVDCLIYMRPTEPFGPFEIIYVRDLIAQRAVTTVVIDSLGEAFGTEGINEDRDNEVGPWLRNVARALADEGPAVVLVDHSTKSTAAQLHASGSKRKRAAIGGASYLVDTVTPFVKGGNGRLRIICAKDRHGTYRRDELVAWLDLNTHPDGTVTLELVAPAPEADAADSVDLLGGHIIAAVTDAAEPMSMNRIRAALSDRKVKAGKSRIDDAIEVLAHRGDLHETAGPRNARLFQLGSEAKHAE